MIDESKVLQAINDGLKARHEISSLDLGAVCLLALFILGGGLLVLNQILQADQEKPSNLWGERLGQYTLQILGLTFILPTILIIAVATGLNAEAVTALLGSIIGYIFGSSRAAETAPPGQSAALPPPAPQPPPGPKDPNAPSTSHASVEPKAAMAPEATSTQPNTSPSGAAPTGP
ncbi:hypothetical protein [Bradyrhizobium sp. OK095]|uniref:hypothetical protein n=1 Tax=Bradyrhizobium sp. OK095 TaxID=1882760 RepID=UPI000B82C5DD|nr:hypothetical protein [Bradyrhizobium sp. OK095]